MYAPQLVRLVEKAMAEALIRRMIWYSLKYERRELIQFGRDVEVGKLTKGKEEYAYIYAARDSRLFVRWLLCSVGVASGSRGMSSSGRSERRVVNGAVNVEGKIARANLGKGLAAANVQR